MLQTIEKAGNVLDLFTVGRPEWSLSEIVDVVDVPRSSTHSLLASLVEIGLLQTVGRGRYRVGWRLVELSEAHRRLLDPTVFAQEELRSLSGTTGESVHLVVLTRWRAVCVQAHRGRRTVAVTGGGVGTSFEPHRSAVGKVLLAARHPEELCHYLGSYPLRRLATGAIVMVGALAAELEAVRHAGTATDNGEMIDGVCCVAAPVRDELGLVVAAIGISAPTTRFTATGDHLREAVAEAAELASAVPAPSRP